MRGGLPIKLPQMALVDRRRGLAASERWAALIAKPRVLGLS